ncbi:MxaD protein [Oleiphilus messinensis]|uniref:MxaD protein n=1 Tax=Oleiphilus messinensis TaxID=141451 RepID=A0A1Y0I2W9_9GAMM|nr:SRPBCC family protein [Oleiphilus messinensis]ARU54610.1 MxaD protein [Oleiphilus messinensis]
MHHLKTLLFICALAVLNGCASVDFPTNFTETDRVYDDLNVNALTNAPQYAISVAQLNAPPEAVFEVVADHENLRDWVPMIDHLVEVDHSQSLPPGRPGVGTVRICDFAGDILTEDILYWKEGVGYAYSVRDHEDLAVTKHLGVIWVEPDQRGGSYISWRQFFEKKPGSIKAHMMPVMMSYVMDSALDNLVDKWGGEVQ